MDETILTTKQVAALLGVHPQTVITWANEGRLPHFRTPGARADRRYRRSDIEALAQVDSTAPEAIPA